MKKYVFMCATLVAAMAITSCGSSKESAYRKAYEKAKAQEQEQGQAQGVNQEYAQQVQGYVQQPTQYTQQPTQYAQQPSQYTQQPTQYTQQPATQTVTVQSPVVTPLEAPAQQQAQQPVQQVQQPTQVTTKAANTTVVAAPKDNVPVRTESVSLVKGAGLKAYSVVVGSFGVLANAEGLQNTLNAAGYQAQIVKNNDRNMYRVVVTTFDSKDSAVDSRNSIRATYPDAWLLMQK